MAMLQLNLKAEYFFIGGHIQRTEACADRIDILNIGR